MTKIIIVPMEGAKRPNQEQINSQLSKMLDAACNEDGSWKKGWELGLLQAYVRKENIGRYTVVHNLNNKNYSLSYSLIKAQGNINVIQMGSVSFTLETVIDGTPKDCAFRFAMSILNG